MSRTFRKRDNYVPWWLSDTNWNHRKQEPQYSDEFLKKLKLKHETDKSQGDLDKCPPKWFRKTEQRKHRHKSDRILKTDWYKDPVIQSDYKMPWYT